MTQAKAGFARLDTHKRINLNRYTELEHGDYYRVDRNADGTLTLTPQRSTQALASAEAAVADAELPANITPIAAPVSVDVYSEAAA